jgi:hypothetical protein
MRSRILRWVGLVACIGKMITVNKIFVGKPEGNHFGEIALNIILQK